jgi:hypothetical protein
MILLESGEHELGTGCLTRGGYQGGAGGYVGLVWTAQVRVRVLTMLEP